MRNLKRNTTVFEYLPYTGRSSDIDENGDHDGDPQPVYGTPVTYRGTISTPSGYTNPTFYGQDIRYTHVLIMTNMKADIRESGIIRWKGNLYEIRAVMPSLNVLNVALRRMTVDETVITEEETQPDTEEEELGGDGE